MHDRLILLGFGILVLAFAACADEASAPTDEESLPSSQQGADDQQPPEPVLGEGVEELGGKTIVIALSPGVPYNLTPYEIQVGGERPPCDQFVFAFGWKVIDPREPPADFPLSWVFTVGDQSVDVGAGATGVSEAGCGTLTATNDSEGDASIAVEYVVGRKP